MINEQDLLWLAPLLLWELVWKSLALWRAARNSQKGWFIGLLILNTAGVLPIVYLLLNRRSQQNKS